MTRQEEHALIALAAAARRCAYAPYSRFTVGAAAVADDDRTFFGCNVENASLGLTLCAERVAIATAVASGVRRLRAIVVMTGAEKPSWPCGACLQWIAEFGSDETLVIAATASGLVRRANLCDLIKEPFDLIASPSNSDRPAMIFPSPSKGEGASNVIPSPSKGEGASNVIPSPSKGEGASNVIPSPLTGEG